MIFIYFGTKKQRNFLSDYIDELSVEEVYAKTEEEIKAAEKLKKKALTVMHHRFGILKI